ncbi:uncharacterized protein TNIN_208471 [Trichonephila inaurata madagascariensis]|uniref:Uncharacterized protein n=1 Tax=Trichonephila inaurata madagascariensis TaxID=2747483 RepID=A0A8X6Y300_9ARAC|nr:uncharacterized protein TNIN_208471 [Trichonephila inaurata madagascariensis]
MIPILQSKDTASKLICIHHDTFPVFFEKYIFPCNVGTRVKVFGHTEEEGYVFLEFERTKTGFLYNAENYRRNYFISKYVSEETGWTMSPDEWRDMIYHGFICSFPTLYLHTAKDTLHIKIIDRKYDERKRYPERFSTIAYLQMKPVRRAMNEKIFTSLNTIE